MDGNAADDLLQIPYVFANITVSSHLPGVEAEVSLVSEVVGVEDDLDKVGLRDEGLRLLDLAAEKAWLLAVGDIGLCVAVHYLSQQRKECLGCCVPYLFVLGAKCDFIFFQSLWQSYYCCLV